MYMLLLLFWIKWKIVLRVPGMLFSTSVCNIRLYYNGNLLGMIEFASVQILMVGLSIFFKKNPSLKYQDVFFSLLHQDILSLQYVLYNYFIGLSLQTKFKFVLV